jgi:TPR repeat protein
MFAFIITLGFCLAAFPTFADTSMAEATRYFEKKDYQAALKEIKPLAETGNVDAQYNLGVMYDKGLGVIRNANEAIKWYRKAAEKGQPAAQFNLGILYQHGESGDPDSAEAARWFQKAADQGIVEAQYSLGVMYHRGEGVPQDYQQALRRYRQAGKRGYAAALYNLSVMYRRGEGSSNRSRRAGDFMNRQRKREMLTLSTVLRSCTKRVNG